MIHKSLGLAVAILALTACDNKSGGEGGLTSSGPVEAVPAPNGGDWTTIVAATPEGGFRMGNPDAAVKLVEFGSMTCPHCADFDEAAMQPLTEQYVKTGKVSLEFRNFVRDGYDLAASVVARCAGPAGFFGMTRQLYADQREWMQKIQAADPARMQQISALAPNQQLAAVADIAGFRQFAAQRGIPSAKLDACLADPNTPTQLVQHQTDAVSEYNIPGTPSFLLNGKMVEIKPGSSPWTQVEAALKDALGG